MTRPNPPEVILIGFALLLTGAAPLRTSPDLGKAEGQCRQDETGPAFLVTVIGLKDRRGNLKLEVYPANDSDFLQDDNILLNQGKTFRRVEVPVPKTGTPQLCIRLPAPGTYAVSLLHDRDRNRKFGFSVDGVGFSGNPKLGWSKPKVSRSMATAGPGLTHIEIVLNYLHGILSFSPLERHNAHR